jgi:hypothetical protein
MKYKTLKLQRSVLLRAKVYRRKQRYFTIALFVAILWLAWCAGPNL